MSDFSLNWIYIAISWVLLRWHDLWSALFGNSSVAWVLSIVFLVITVRVILFPVFVKQIKSQRAMQTLQPQVKELQEKHKGDRETLQKEMMELYRREKANPLMGCLPIFLQIPVFIGLFHVLKSINPTIDKWRTAMINEYGWSSEQFDGASEAKLFGAPIAAKFSSSAAELSALTAQRTTVQIVAAVLIAIMVATTYLTQRQMIARTGPATDPQQAMIQRLMLYGIPASLLISGAVFPIGVVIYWCTTNLFSMGQQQYVLAKMPPPGGAKPDDTRIPSVDPKALAPKPGVKPANPKKGVRAVAGTGTVPSENGGTRAGAGQNGAADGLEVNGNPRVPANGATAVAGTAPGVNGGGADAHGADLPSAQGSVAAVTGSSSTAPVQGGAGGSAASGARGSTAARRSGDNRTRKRKGGRR